MFVCNFVTYISLLLVDFSISFFVNIMEQWCIAQLLARLQSNLFNDERRILNFSMQHYEKTIFWMMMQFGCTRAINQVIAPILWKIGTWWGMNHVWLLCKKPNLWWEEILSSLPNEALFVAPNCALCECMWWILHATTRRLWHHGFVCFVEMYYYYEDPCLWCGN